MQFSTADWLVVAIFAVGSVAALLTAWRTARAPIDEDESEHYRRRPILIALAPKDRELLEEIKDNIGDLPRSVQRHREAIEDHADAMKRRCD